MNIQRNTVQRQIVLDALKKLNKHPTIDEIYAAIHSSHPSISKATVYRNLRQLAANRIIRQVSLLDGLERYDARTGQHYHFKCVKCGNILDVEIEYLADINYVVQRKYCVQVDEHDIVFSGTCMECEHIETDNAEEFAKT